MKLKNQQEFKKDERERSEEEKAIRARVEDDEVLYLGNDPSGPVFIDD